MGRFCFMRLLLFTFLLCQLATAATVRIQDTLYEAGGLRAEGTIRIRVPVSFTTANGRRVPRGTVRFGRNEWYAVRGGRVNLRLEANDTSLPAGTYYEVEYRLRSTTFRETWLVPTSATPLAIDDVALQVLPGLQTQVLLTQLAASGAVEGQSIVFQGGRWTVGSAAAPGTAVPYPAPATNTNSLLVAATAHGQGVHPQVGSCFDASTPASAVEPGSVEISSSGDVTITFATTFTGTCPIYGAGELVPVAFVAETLVSVPAATHGLGMQPVFYGCRGPAQRIEPGSVSVGIAGQVEIRFLSAQTGTCFLGRTVPAVPIGFSAVSQVTVVASTHGLGVAPLLLACRDSEDPALYIQPGSVTVSSTGQVDIRFASSQTGVCYLR